MATFLYYRHDGAYYRRPAEAGGIGVREILHGTKWDPYDADDLIAPVFYGSQVDEAEIEREIASHRDVV